MGYRILPHTADVMIEAWGPTRESCLEDAARALIATFADLSNTVASGSVEVAFDETDDEELLVALLDEVVYLAEVRGVIPVDVAVGHAGGSIAATFDVAPLSEVVPAGAAPKAVTRHALAFERTPAGWICRATIDI